ncbi:MAG: dTDP-4-dehydrorhamnose reductase [Planctomycetaceae bacterium]|nr:dTDP-4-dehydrorhamnose reductase [Planctomycetaceae bacterium]
MRIGVLGAAGQLGRDLCPILPGEVVPLSRAEIDLSQTATIAATLTALNLDILVNCAAYNFVDKAEVEPDAAFAVNVWGVRSLAQGCSAARIKFVHFSTDYVFGLDATRSTPFAEDDAPGPVSVYGLSKLTGEYVARTHAPDSIVIRTCGLYGIHGTGGKGGNFVETMLRVAGQGKPLRVVADQHCTPSYTVDVAQATVGLIRTRATGLFHVTNAGSCTWHELATEIFRLANLKPDLTPITSAQFGAPARRPPYSVLSNAKLATVGVQCPRPWSEALADYMTERQGRR